LQVQVAAKADQGIVRIATLRTTSFAGGNEHIGFDLRRESVFYKHTGPATDFSVILSQSDTNGLPHSFVSVPIHLKPGDTAVITPRNWDALDGKSVDLMVSDSLGNPMSQLLNVAPPVLVLQDGGIRLSFTGHIGLTYAIETSINLRDWTVVTMLACDTGILSYTEAEPAAFQHRFYRAVQTSAVEQEPASR
jgi:hypothetical protein